MKIFNKITPKQKRKYTMVLKKVIIRLSRMIKKLKAVIKDKNRKNIIRIIWELIVIAVNRKCLPTHYFSNFIYRKGVNNYLDYITNGEAKRIDKSAHCRATYQLLDNKLLLQEHFLRLGVPMPAKVAFNYKHFWFIEEKGNISRIEVKTISEFIDLLSHLFTLADFNEIFAKPIISYGGMGAVKISRSMLSNNNNEKIKIIFNLVNTRCYILQESIDQHPEMSKLNPSSVNTIRLATFNNLSARPELISAILRIGREGNIVDNVMAGGLFVGVDLDTGRLNDYAFTELEHGGHIYSCHPDTDVEFRNIIIPYFRDVKKIALKAATLISSKFMGWDIAITSNGPLLVEANHSIHLGLFDVTYGGLRKSAIFRKVMLEAGIHSDIKII